MDKRITSQIWAAVLSLTAVFGGMGCLVSGFGLEPMGFGTVISWILAAAVFSICFAHRIALYPMAGLVLLGAFLWVRGYLSGSLELLLEELSATYSSAYGWGILSWNTEALENVHTGTALCWLGLPIVISTCFAVLRRSYISLAVTLAVLPLGCCMIVTDTVPGVLPLFLLLLTVLLLMMSQTVRRRDEEQGNRLLAILVLPVALGLGLLFLLIPQAGYDHQEGAQRLEDTVVNWFQGDFQIPELPQPTAPETPQTTRPPVGTGSIARQENLMTVGPKVQSDMRIMTVTAEQAGLLYLRGAGYDTYSGTSWTARAEENAAYWPGQELLEDGGNVSISTMVAHEALYLPYYVSSDNYAALDGGSLNNVSRDRTYSFHQGILPVQTLVTGAGEGYEEDMQPYLQLPEETAVWARDVIETIFGTDTPPLTAATVYTIAEYVRASAEYDLDTPRMDEAYDDFAQWFLMESDSGYCIHFASATAVLLRAAGIPSRYVTGYTVYAAAGQSTTVTGKHAHAWAEFRLPAGSWYPLESTPAYEEETPSFTLPEFPDFTEPSESPETIPTEGTVETVPDATQAPVSQEEPPKAMGSLWGWIAAVLLCAAVVAQWRIRVSLLRSREARGRSKQKALARWQHHALMAKLLNQPADRELLETAQKARFSQHPITAEELAAFTKVIRSQTQELKKKPFYLQLYYTLILALY